MKKNHKEFNVQILISEFFFYPMVRDLGVDSSEELDRHGKETGA